MNKKEAIKYLKQLYPNGGHCWLDEQRIEAIDIAVKALQEKSLKIKKGCKYRCLSDMVNTDTGKISFIGGKVYLAPKDNTLVSEENGWLCDTSENTSNFELVEEPASGVWHDMSEDAENGRNIIIIDPKDFYGAVLRKGGSQLKNHNKERYVKWAYIDDVINLSNIERTTKNWKVSVGEDLNTAAKVYADNITDKVGYRLQLRRAVCFGAQWQKEQLMAKAVDAKITLFDGISYVSKDVLSQFKQGEKVKVIVIKED